MKTGLVLEGGAMRGIFTAGVLDVFMENGLYSDGAVGVSAGAAFGCNYKSRQIGRVLRYNKNYCRDRRYVSLRSWITTGDLYNVDFAYSKIPDELDPFDNEAYNNSDMEFYAVCTDASTGKAVYHKCDTASGNDLLWIRASASLPLAARLVNIDGQILSDGGMADSIPIKFFQSIGYDKNIVILTQPLGYVKKPSSMLPVIRLVLRKYPKLIEAIATRHIRYNETLKYLKEEEASGNVLVIRPEEPLKIGKTERNPQAYDRVYEHGRAIALKHLDSIRKYMGV